MTLSTSRLSPRINLPRAGWHWLVRIGAVCATAACGGGGGGEAPQPSVASANASVVNYSQAVTVTLNGADLDKGLDVSTPACPTMALSTEPSHVSGPTKAYYRCTGATAGASMVTVKRASDGAMLATDTFNVNPPPRVKFTVNGGPGVQGEFVVTLAADSVLTPTTVNNFLAYVTAGHYNGTLFHRVYSDFVVQGGGYELPASGGAPTLRLPARAPIPLEVNKGLSNKQWTIAMARGSARDSAQAQFYINDVDNLGLDPDYAVFGHVSSGIDVVQAIATRGCTLAGASAGQSCWPNPNVIITSAIQIP
jgi:peptidyl-prolyl cis-trans isomerase A (cyclophilin A)